MQSLLSCVARATGGERLECRTLDCTQYANVTDGPIEGVVCFGEEDDRFSCLYTTELEPAIGRMTRIDAIVNCAHSETLGFDVLNSTDCTCQATLTRDSGSDQVCGCNVCEGGSAQVLSLDCRSNTDDPFIVDMCPTLTCNGECIAPEDEAFLSNFEVELFADQNLITQLNITDVSDGFYPINFVPALGYLFFQATSASTGYELWTTDGTLNETLLVKDINPGASASLDESGSFALESAELDGRLLFFATDGVRGKELWRSDGTANGTILVKSIVEGNEGVSIMHFPRGSMLRYKGNLYFVVVSEENGRKQLWKTDGTRGGTMAVEADHVLPSSIRVDSFLERTSFDDRIYFVASPRSRNVSSTGPFLYSSDGSLESTKKLSDQPIPANQGELVEFKKKIYFGAGSLWMTNGMRLGTMEVAGPGGAPFDDPQSIITVNARLFFWSKCRLWSYNGNEGGFVKLFDDGKISDCNTELVKLGNKVLFRSGNLQQPWISNGTLNGTYALADVALTSTATFAVWGNKLAFFAATRPNADLGHALWVTDGSVANTTIIEDIGTDELGLYPHFDTVLVFDNTVYLTVWYLFGPGDEIWKVNIAADGFDVSPVVSSMQVNDTKNETAVLATTEHDTTNETVEMSIIDPEAPVTGMWNGIAFSLTTIESESNGAQGASVQRNP
jgi:ELWxxDGT repeat protein